MNMFDITDLFICIGVAWVISGFICYVAGLSDGREAERQDNYNRWKGTK